MNSPVLHEYEKNENNSLIKLRTIPVILFSYKITRVIIVWTLHGTILLCPLTLRLLSARRHIYYAHAFWILPIIIRRYYVKYKSRTPMTVAQSIFSSSSFDVVRISQFCIAVWQCSFTPFIFLQSSHDTSGRNATAAYSYARAYYYMLTNTQAL